MIEYSEAFKSRMVQRLMGPNALTANALAEKVSVAQPTLSLWLRVARGNIELMSNDSPSTPAASKTPPPPRSTKDWSPEERFRVLTVASTLKDSELGAFLRREGLHEATLREWRAAALEGLTPQRDTRTRAQKAAERKRIRDLERELRRKDKALAEAAALLVLQKKLHAIWGVADDDTEPRSDE